MTWNRYLCSNDTIVGEINLCNKTSGKIDLGKVKVINRMINVCLRVYICSEQEFRSSSSRICVFCRRKERLGENASTTDRHRWQHKYLTIAQFLRLWTTEGRRKRIRVVALKSPRALNISEASPINYPHKSTPLNVFNPFKLPTIIHRQPLKKWPEETPSARFGKGDNNNISRPAIV